MTCPLCALALLASYYYFRLHWGKYDILMHSAKTACARSSSRLERALAPPPRPRLYS